MDGENTFVLYRIIRISQTQTRTVLENLQFMLQHESRFPNCEKRWVVNRIVDPKQEKQILDLLQRHRQSYS
ncbi:hypothetical protein [Paenibacillus koleovorans]|uniref:hypothetical protein n=1 Tax=Paenibacillus koleovorans TaxID=121608 RepID=UPI000FD8EC92|nr:hypothetical protein [Paenibacillus koleovorans]